ncbi:hypothetical protein QE385_002321 [Sphingomonas sp. SORGH_AS 950]|nr:hypothetical protein [Sphingomonas sp. SORGH_AS_0950]
MLKSNETWRKALGSVVERHGCVYGPWMQFDVETMLGND